MKASENIVGKGENADNQHFLLCPQCFLPFSKEFLIFLSFLFCYLQTVISWTCLKICHVVELTKSICVCQPTIDFIKRVNLYFENPLPFMLADIFFFFFFLLRQNILKWYRSKIKLLKLNEYFHEYFRI